MVYQQKLVAVIKYNGKILREKDNNTVYLPFLAEYQIYIKNLESRDVVISISIDGKDVLDNNRIVIKANSSTSLEGFLKGNQVTNRFKFIQKTKQIQDHRGDRIDDGIIRIEYQYVKQNQTITTTHIYEHYDYHHPFQWYHPPWCTCPYCKPYYPKPIVPHYPYQVWYGSTSESLLNKNFTVGGGDHNLTGTKMETGNHGIIPGEPFNSLGNKHKSGEGPVTGSLKSSHKEPAMANVNTMFSSVNEQAFMPQMDEGITVKGSESNQEFGNIQTDPLEENKNVIIINLRGYKGSETLVEKPILVNTKIKCTTCGIKNKSSHKYCKECGSALF